MQDHMKKHNVLPSNRGNASTNTVWIWQQIETNYSSTFSYRLRESDEVSVEAKNSARYLGVEIDRKLNYGE